MQREHDTSVPNPDSLPTEIGSRVAIQFADIDAFRYLCWRGFDPESGEIGGMIVMRRDFADGAFAHYPEPALPGFPIQILS
jgi:hypothetical protein